MPKRTDIQSVMIIGAGPIIIGQACEFDYSGVQACKALREEGYRIILVNSNPATIMTDPGMADATYIEPVDWKTAEKIIERERPDAVLPTMGGQTALNCTLDLAHEGVLDHYGVEIIGATEEAINKAEDRELFRQSMAHIGLDCPQAGLVRNMEQAHAVQSTIGFPTIIRPSFTLGGTGGGIAYNHEEFIELCEQGLRASPTTEVLLEESLIGWKEFEMEVVRDSKDNCIIVCSIENVDPMGVHTGDSITVAPALTLTDKEYQRLRDASIAVLREIGVDTGGSNVQFALNPNNGKVIVIEMNPRVSRSSALASKATGFPIARVAAKLAVGFTLDELKNEITDGATPASFEPTIDYVVTKIPRFNFEKFPQTESVLTTQMKSVGEVMAIGRTFQESLQKALRSLETNLTGLDEIIDPDNLSPNVSTPDVRLSKLKQELCRPSQDRLRYVADALRAGMSVAYIHQQCGIDAWFLHQIEDLLTEEKRLSERSLSALDHDTLRRLKRKGFSDARIARLLGVTETGVREHRTALGIRPVYKRVDSCAAEFVASTAYLYSTYEDECEAEPTTNKKIIVLGGGPNRIGQGIEFDYCCVQAALAIHDDGFESIMVNCNPETVSTDYDTSDRLYFEPLTLEDVLEICHVEQPNGVIVQYGGQTPLKLCRALGQAGVPIIGTSPDSIDKAENRERFQQLIEQLGLRQPRNRIAFTADEALRLTETLRYPLVVRPSYVLGGRAMEIVYNTTELSHYIHQAISVSDASPILLDEFLGDAIEVDVDAISDGEQVLIGGIMEHVEQAGVHSGDSACSLPPFSLSVKLQSELRSQTEKLALAIGVCGLMNVQFAIQAGVIYILEVNPRASRTVPFVSKATGMPLARIGVQCMLERSLSDLGYRETHPGYYSVKESVFPFSRFPGVDSLLGPEMKSTGEVMGIGSSFGEAFRKALSAAGNALPEEGTVLLSVCDADKTECVHIARMLQQAGYQLAATSGTAQALRAGGLDCILASKVNEKRPDTVDMLKNGEIQVIINTTEGRQTIADSYTIRRTALQHRVPYFTTIAGARAMAKTLTVTNRYSINRLQDLHGKEST